jgi:hypothetical protein
MLPCNMFYHQYYSPRHKLKMNLRHSILVALIIVFLVLLAACAPAPMTPLPAAEKPATPTPMASPPAIAEITLPPTHPALPTFLPTRVAPTQVAPTQVAPTQVAPTQVAPTQVAPYQTEPPPALPTALPTPNSPEKQAPTPEAHSVQVEWPARIRLGESDVVHLTLIPTSKSYLLVTEYPEHQTITQTVPIQRASGYDLFAAARLDGVGFTISPDKKQVQYLPVGEFLTFRWSLLPHNPGRQRLVILLALRWVPGSTYSAATREAIAYTQALDVQVLSFFGLSQA